MEHAVREEHFRRIGEFWQKAHTTDSIVRALNKSVDYLDSFIPHERSELMASIGRVPAGHILAGRRQFPLSVGGTAEDVIHNRIAVALRKRIRDVQAGRW